MSCLLLVCADNNVNMSDIGFVLRVAKLDNLH